MRILHFKSEIAQRELSDLGGGDHTKAKDLASQLREELESRLSIEEIEMAEARAGSKPLDQLVRQFLVSA